MPAMTRAARGLEDIVIGDSALTLVEGEVGTLAYRGFDIAELAAHADYEGVVHLLLVGAVPDAAQREAIRPDLAQRRSLPAELSRLASTLPTDLPPLEGLRTLLSALGTPSYSYPPTLAQGLDLIAKAPTLLTALVRAARGAPAVAPDPRRGHVENYLWMLTGTTPSARQRHALETYFILLADHGMNASTFALRTVISTNADLLSAAVAALSALKGPLHGGAPSKVSDMLDAVGSADRAEPWVREALGRKERLMGFGHRAYKTEDPRARVLKRIALECADPERYALAEAVERVALEELRRSRPGQRLYTNVEFWGAVVLEIAEIPAAITPALFACARTGGWSAHIVEQKQTGRLIRPSAVYTGPAERRLSEL